jgi:hypothetical protein
MDVALDQELSAWLGKKYQRTGAMRVWWRLDDKIRMTREFHVRICGAFGEQFPGATRRDS